MLELAKSTALNLGKLYNPLYVYGEHGVGKTHFLHAIGNLIKSEMSSLKVIYTTAERFTNELIYSIKNDENEWFRYKYRQCDVLLFDDINFFRGKERSQEEFKIVINDLVMKDKQVVVSCDCKPSENRNFDDGIISILEAGLIVELKPLRDDLKFEIAEKLKKKYELEISDEILSLIFNNGNTQLEARNLHGIIKYIHYIEKVKKEKISLLDLIKIYEEYNLNKSVKLIGGEFE